MNLKQLEYFSAVAEAKSISLAARNLHVAQPPISRQLALLEDELGVCLFLRTNKGVELTEAGRSLYRQSQNLFQDMRMIVDSVRDINAGMRGLLKIGMIYSNISIALQYLKEFRAQYPQVELYVRLGSPGDLLEDLNKGDLHLLFLRSSSERGSGLHERILGEDPLELVMIRELDPAPDQASVPPEALKGVPMCLLRSDDLWGYSNYLIKECQRQGFTPNTTFRCYDTPMAMQLVQAGFGVSYLPRSIVETQPHLGLYTKPIQGISVLSYPTLVWSSNLYYASCVKRFLAMFEGEDAEK
jgi:DNA-binding transcriptional LysR family regulator